MSISTKIQIENNGNKGCKMFHYPWWEKFSYIEYSFNSNIDQEE